MLDDKDPAGYSYFTYVWVVAIAILGGLVRFINKEENLKNFSYLKFIIDLITAMFTGILTFWLCESLNIHGAVAAFLIATGGSMGNRAWREFERIFKNKLGMSDD